MAERVTVCRTAACTGELISSHHHVEITSGVLISISFCSISVCLRADVTTLPLPGAPGTCFPDVGFAPAICLPVFSAVGIFLICVH